MLKIGHKTISVYEAINYYTDSRKCQRVLALSNPEYIEMLIQLVTFLKDPQDRPPYEPSHQQESSYLYQDQQIYQNQGHTNHNLNHMSHQSHPHQYQSQIYQNMPNHTQMDQKIFSRIFDLNGGNLPDLRQDPRVIGNTQTRMTRQYMYPNT